MADQFRIVTIGRDGRARLFQDLEVRDVVYKLRDTLSYTPATRRSITAPSSSRWTGTQTVGEARDNAQLGATLTIKGATPATAADRIERILDRVDSARRDLYIEWRPEGLARSVYSRITGPGSYGVQYRWVEWLGIQRIGVPVSWPVEPLPQGLPCTIEERFQLPPDKDEGATNLVQDPLARYSAANVVATIAGAAITYPASSDPDFGTYGRTIDWTGGTSAGADNMQIVRYTGGGGNQAPAVARAAADIAGGRFFAFRMRVKIVRKLTGVTAAPFRIKVVWLTSSATDGPYTATSSPQNAGTYNVGDIVEMAGVLQAPAGAIGALFGLTATGAGAAVDGSVRVGRFMVAEVETLTTAVPGYGDGDQATFRWQGDAHASRSIELAESKLAEYSAVGADPAYTRVTQGGLYQSFGAAGGGLLAHTAREWVPDGEVMVGGIYAIAGTGGANGFLAPGLRYDPRDGRYFWATINATDLTLYVWNPAIGAVQLATVAHGQAFAAASGRTWWIVLRAEGDVITAELYGQGIIAPGQQPSPSRYNRAASCKYVVDGVIPDAAGMGAGRQGYPMIRAQAMTNGGAAQLTHFDWHPYAYRTIAADYYDTNLPETFRLEDVPGSAPALLEPAYAKNTNIDSSALRFGLLAWAQLRGRENMVIGRQPRPGATFIGAGSDDDYNPAPLDVTAESWSETLPPDPEVQSYQPVKSSANAAQTYQRRHFRNLKANTQYTVEMWLKTVNFGSVPNWTVRRFFDAGATTNVAVINAVQDWTFYRDTFRTAAAADKFTLELVHNGVANHEIRYAGLRFYEGTPTDRPTGVNQTRDHGAPPPIGYLGLNTVRGSDVVAGQWVAGFAMAPASNPAQNLQSKGGWQARHATNVAGPGRLCFIVDPELITPPDFAGDTIDLEVYVLGEAHLVADAYVNLSTWHESDMARSGRRYTREFGSVGRRILPLNPTTNPHGYVTRAGTVTIGRDGRWIIAPEFTYTVSAAGSYIGVDGLVVAPAWARASGPTSKPDAGYPEFVGNWPTNEIDKVVSPDGAGFGARLGRRFPHYGIAGARLEVPAGGDVAVLFWAYESSPDATDQVAAGGLTALDYNGLSAAGGLVRFGITPRYRVMAG